LIAKLRVPDFFMNFPCHRAALLVVYCAAGYNRQPGASTAEWIAFLPDLLASMPD
jgi:hypothetical protein